MTLVSDLHYFPPITSFKNLYNFSNIIFEQYVHLPRKGFYNRMFLANANGILRLTIPLQGGRNQKTIYKDIRVDPKQTWQRNHWLNIESAYNRSPWFAHYKDSLADLYTKSHAFLVDWNLACMRWTLEQIGVDKPALQLTPEYIRQYDPLAYEDRRNLLDPANYLRAGINPYRQVFEERNGFLKNLSILDLLFCEGNNSSDWFL